MHFVGYPVDREGFQYFKSEQEPTGATHGHQYRAVVGPFRTARAARWGRIIIILQAGDGITLVRRERVELRRKPALQQL